MMEAVADFEALSELVRMTASSGVSRHALLVRTERLPGSMSRSERTRHARAALDPLNNAERAHWYDLPGGRIVVSWKGDQARLVTQAIDGLSRLTQTDAIDQLPMPDIVGFYVLPDGGEELLRASTADLPIAVDEPPPEPVHQRAKTRPAAVCTS